MSAFIHATLGDAYVTHYCLSLLLLPSRLLFHPVSPGLSWCVPGVVRLRLLDPRRGKQLIMLTLSQPREGDKLLFQFPCLQFPCLSIRRRAKHDISICCRGRGCKVVTNKVLLLSLINNNNNSNGNDNNKSVPMCVTCWQCLSEIVIIDTDEFLYQTVEWVEGMLFEPLLDHTGHVLHQCIPSVVLMSRAWTKINRLPAGLPKPMSEHAECPAKKLLPHWEK